MTPDPTEGPAPPGQSDDGKRQPESSNPEDELSIQRRGFVTTSGVVCQVVGIILVLGSCGFGSLSGWFQQKSDHPVDSFADYFAAANIGFATATIATLASFAGGLALVAAGVGMQGERDGSARLGMVVSALLMLIWFSAAGVSGFALDSWARAIGCMILGSTCLAIFMLAGNSARLMKISPPPQDQGAVTDEFLESLKKRRHY